MLLLSHLSLLYMSLCRQGCVFDHWPLHYEQRCGRQQCLWSCWSFAHWWRGKLCKVVFNLCLTRRSRSHWIRSSYSYQSTARWCLVQGNLVQSRSLQGVPEESHSPFHSVNPSWVQFHKSFDLRRSHIHHYMLRKFASRYESIEPRLLQFRHKENYTG